MSRVLHVVHGETLRDRPALGAALRRRREADGSRLVVVGPSSQGPGLIRLPDVRRAASGLRRWLCNVDMDLLLAWDEASVPLVGAQDIPCAAILDGLVHPEAHRTLIDWVRDRRMPVLVTSPSLAEYLTLKTHGRARVQVIEPMAEALDELPCATVDRVDAIQVVAHPGRRFSLRSVLEGVIRSGLTGRPVQVHADASFGDWQHCDAMLRASSLPSLKLKPEGQARWWAGPALCGDRRSLEPVLDVVQAWVHGGHVLLAGGHGAEPVLGGHPGVLLNVDGDAEASCKVFAAQDAPDDTAANRASVQARWAQSASAMLDVLAPVAQRS